MAAFLVSFWSPMDLAVITVSYNTRELLADCLESVLDDLERSGLVGEVWVVDNASADGSADMVRQRFPQVRLIAHDENLGFAAGNNLALATMGFRAAQLAEARTFPESRHTRVGRCPGRPGRLYGLDTQRRRRWGAPSARRRQLPALGICLSRLAQIFLDFFPIHHRLLDSRLNGRYPRQLYEKANLSP